MIAVLFLAAGTFLVTVPWGGPLISWLEAHGVGKQIRVDGPPGHEAKRGTPTMGGALILAPLLILGGLVSLRDTRIWSVLAATMLFGALGGVDDLRGLSDEKGVGWLARYKLPWQAALGLLAALGLYWAGAPREMYLPLLHSTLNLGLWFIPIGAFIIVAMANGVNFNDGLDGLAGGTSALAFAAYAAILLMSLEADVPLALLCAVFVGAILAFLWYNVHPARVIMGDLGALALGAGLASVALLSGQWLVLPLVGGVYTLEVLSVVLQVGYFKLTHGRRIFRMSPLHCHFEVCGMPETRIVLRTWILAGVLATLGLALAVARL